MDKLELLMQIAVSLAAIIPLIVALIKFVVKSVKEKNWLQMVNLALKLIAEAGSMFQTGADKKSYVMQMVKAAAKELNYEIDENALSNLIDSIIGITKTVNVDHKED